MALIRCRECGRDISDKAVSCPSCGCPAVLNGGGIVENHQYHNHKKTHIPSLVLSIIGLIFFWGIMSYIGLPCAIIGLVFAVKKRHIYKTTPALVMSIIAIGIQIVFFVIAFSESIMYYL